MPSKRYGSSLLVRGPGIPQKRWNPGLDGQTFRMNRGRRVRAYGQAKTTFVPLETYWAKVSCQEWGCPAYQNGFTMTFDLSPTQPDLVMMQARYRAVTNSGRSYTECWDGEGCNHGGEIVTDQPGLALNVVERVKGTTVRFHIPAGQQCFKEHILPLERDPRFIHIKGNGGREVGFDEFFDTFNETTHQLSKRGTRHG